MSHYHDNQLAAAMMLRGYGLKPGMPGFGYQVKALGATNTGGYPNPGGFEVEPGNLPGTGGQSWQDQNPQTPSVNINPGANAPSSPSDNPGLGDALHNNFMGSPAGQIYGAIRNLFRPHGTAIPRPNDVPVHSIDWRENAVGHAIPREDQGVRLVPNTYQGYSTPNRIYNWQNLFPGSAIGPNAYTGSGFTGGYTGITDTGYHPQPFGGGFGMSGENSAQIAYLKSKNLI